jgi:hypothetical protein
MAYLETLHEDFLLFSSPYDLDLPICSELEGVCAESDAGSQEELLYDVYVYPDSGEMVQVKQFSSIPRKIKRLRNLLMSTGASVVTLVEAATPNFFTDTTASRSTAPGRAFHQVRRRMVARSLITHARVAYDYPIPMKTIKRDVTKFATRLRKKYKGMPYVAVFERGEVSGLLHWHIALPYYVTSEDIDRCWIRGSTNVSRMKDMDSLERFISYITKTFFKAEYERDFPHRYKKDKTTKIIRTLYEGVTQAEYEVLAQKMAESNPESLKYRTAGNHWIAGSYRWQPEHLNEAFAYVQNVYKPV